MRVCDFAPVLAADRSRSVARTWERDSRGYLWGRGALTWAGVRMYLTEETGVSSELVGGASQVRVLRRESQVTSPSYIRTLQALPATRQHPAEFVTARRAQRLAVGWTGDAVSVETVEGLNLPVGVVRIHDPRTIRDIEGGLSQTSLGHMVLFVAPSGETREREGGGLPIGIWRAPDGREFEYDLEQIADPEDPRALAWREANPDGPGIGGDHFAVALARGRGGDMAELSPVEATDVTPEGVDRDILAVGQVTDAELGHCVPIFDKCADATKNVGTARDARYDVANMSTKPLLNLDLAAFGRGVVTLDSLDSVVGLIDGLREAHTAQGAELTAAKSAVDSLTGERDALKVAADAAKAEAQKATDELTAAKAEIEALKAEVAPLRDAALKSLVDRAVKATGLKAEDFAGLSVADVQRKAVTHMHPELAKDKSDEWVAGVWTVAVSSLKVDDEPAPVKKGKGVSDGFKTAARGKPVGDSAPKKFSLSDHFA